MVSDEEARAAAQEILSQHRFMRWENDFESWLRAFDRLIDFVPSGLIDTLTWIRDTLIDGLLFGFLRAIAKLLRLAGIFGDSPLAIGWLAVCLLLAIGIVLAVRIRGAGWFDSRSDVPSSPSDRTHCDSIHEAKALAQRGHYLEAAHRVQLATLAMLIESDRLELARSDPNRTLRRRVADSSLPESERRQLIRLVDRLEALWFDEPREDRALFEDWLALDERLLRVAGGSGR